MNITGKNFAWACVALLAAYPVLAILVGEHVVSNDNYVALAALLAANAGTAFLVELVFLMPEFRRHAGRSLRVIVGFIAVTSGLLSAFYWMADEVEHELLRAGLMAPVVAILIVLLLFMDTANKGRTSNADDQQRPED